MSKTSLRAVFEALALFRPHFVVQPASAGHDESVTVLVQFQARLESREAFSLLMQSVQQNLPQVPGCLGVDVLRSAANPLCFVLVERWESQARHGAHVQALQASGDWSALEQHLAAAPSVEYLQRI